MSEKSPNDTDRDARLEALYRAVDDDQPHPALDDAIRAAARRAVASRPRLAGAPFGRSWRVPLSIAAVMVLSVSLVTLMREEAPEIAQPPGADVSAPSAESAPGARLQAPALPGTLADGQRSSSGLGLKLSQPSSGLGIRGDTEATASVKLRKETTTTDRMESAPSVTPRGKDAAPAAFPGEAAMRDNRIAAPVEQSRQAAKNEARRDTAVVAEPQRPAAAGAVADSKARLNLEADSAVRGSERVRAPEAPAAAAAKSASAPLANAPAEDKVQAKQDAGGFVGSLSQPSPARVEARPAPVPAAKPAAAAPPVTVMEKQATPMSDTLRAYANLPPEQWLTRIEELRKQGRLEEAKASLAEFRKRYPDYSLPASLKDGILP